MCVRVSAARYTSLKRTLARADTHAHTCRPVDALWPFDDAIQNVQY